MEWAQESDADSSVDESILGTLLEGSNLEVVNLEEGTSISVLGVGVALILRCTHHIFLSTKSNQKMKGMLFVL